MAWGLLLALGVYKSYDPEKNREHPRIHGSLEHESNGLKVSGSYKDSFQSIVDIHIYVQTKQCIYHFL